MLNPTAPSSTNEHISLAPVLTEFIFLRENFRKFAFEAEFYNIAVGKARKYIGFTALDITDALNNLSITRENGEIFLFNKAIESEELLQIVCKVYNALDSVEVIKPKRCTTKGYIRVLNVLMGALGDMLTEAGVEIVFPSVGGELSIRHHKVVKLEPTSTKELNKRVAKVYNPCYIYQNRVLFHAKVDVFKYEQP